MDFRFGLADDQLGIDRFAENGFISHCPRLALCWFCAFIDIVVTRALRHKDDCRNFTVGVIDFHFRCPDGRAGASQRFAGLAAGDLDRAVSSFQNDACVLAPHGAVRSDSDLAGGSIKPVLSVCAVLLTGDRSIDLNVAGDADEGVAGHSAVNSQVLCPCGVVVVIAYRKTAVDRFQFHIQRGVCVVCRNGQISGNVLGCGQLVGRFIIGHTLGQSRLGILCGDRCAVDAEAIRSDRCRNKSVRADTQILCAHRIRIVDLTFHFGLRSTGCAVACYNIIIAGAGLGKLHLTHCARAAVCCGERSCANVGRELIRDQAVCAVAVQGNSVGLHSQVAASHRAVGVGDLHLAGRNDINRIMFLVTYGGSGALAVDGNTFQQRVLPASHTHYGTASAIAGDVQCTGAVFQNQHAGGCRCIARVAAAATQLDAAGDIIQQNSRIGQSALAAVCDLDITGTGDIDAAANRKAAIVGCYGNVIGTLYGQAADCNAIGKIHVAVAVQDGGTVDFASGSKIVYILNRQQALNSVIPAALFQHNIGLCGVAAGNADVIVGFGVRPPIAQPTGKGVGVGSVAHLGQTGRLPFVGHHNLTAAVNGQCIGFVVDGNGKARRRTATFCRQCAEGTCHLQQHTNAQQTGKEFSGPSFHKMSASSLSLSVSYHACPSSGRSPARIDCKMHRIDPCTILENSAPSFVKLFHFENEPDCLTLPANHAKLSPL